MSVFESESWGEEWKCELKISKFEGMGWVGVGVDCREGAVYGGAAAGKSCWRHNGGRQEHLLPAVLDSHLLTSYYVEHQPTT